MSDVTKLIERLRGFPLTMNALRREAADLIEQQAARIAELEAVCNEAIDWYPTDAAPPYMAYIREVMKSADPAWKDAIRREVLEEAASAALNASLGAIWADGRLMDPREVGSMCADAIRALSQKVGDQQ